MAGKNKSGKGGKVPGASGGSLVGGMIMLVVIGGVVFGIDTFVGDALFSSSEKVNAQIAAYPLSLYSTVDQMDFKRRCLKASSKRAEQRRCRAHYSKLSREQSRVMREVRSTRRGVNSVVNREERRCRRYRDRGGREAHAKWQRDAKRWWNDLSVWSRSGGEHPGIYLPPVPSPCVKRRAPSKDTSSWGRRRRR